MKSKIYRNYNFKFKKWNFGHGRWFCAWFLHNQLISSLKYQNAAHKIIFQISWIWFVIADCWIISKKCGMNFKSKTQRAIPNFAWVVVFLTLLMIWKRKLCGKKSNIIMQSGRSEKKRVLLSNHRSERWDISATWATQTSKWMPLAAKMPNEFESTNTTYTGHSN